VGLCFSPAKGSSFGYIYGALPSLLIGLEKFFSDSVAVCVADPSRDCVADVMSRRFYFGGCIVSSVVVVYAVVKQRYVCFLGLFLFYLHDIYI
jgi:hypothetical protein